jgi:choline-sulfatase
MRIDDMQMQPIGLVLLVLAGLVSWAPARDRNQEPPAGTVRNVVVIMGDDHADYVIGAYGNPIIRTPNLDRLAAEGVRFDRAYSNSPVCTPSRQSMITGTMPQAAGVTLLSTPLSEERTTIADHLKRFGFRTGAIGKMHFINEELTHGFDYRVRSSDYRAHLKRNPPRPPPADLAVRPPWRPFKDPARIWLNADGLPVGAYEDEAEGTWFTRRAADFLRANHDDPFLLFVSFNEPHSPFEFPIEFKGRYNPADMPLPETGPEDARWIPAVFKDLTEEDKRGIIAAYYTSVEYLDRNVGRVLEALRRLALLDSTLVIYTSDHGYLLGHHGRFEKHMMWEEAVRTPLLVSHVPRFGRGRSTQALVELVDLAPTILDALDVAPLPASHGRSLLPLLDGRTDRHRDEVFSVYYPDNKAMIRTAEWKYIFSSGKRDLWSYETGFGPPGRHERLYNMIEDPREFRDLSGRPEHADQLSRFRKMMLQRFHETDPRAPHLPPDLTAEEQLEWFLEPPEHSGTAARQVRRSGGQAGWSCPPANASDQCSSLTARTHLNHQITKSPDHQYPGSVCRPSPRDVEHRARAERALG